MQINLGETNIVEILPTLTEQEIQNRAADQRLDAFGIGVRLMQRPKPSEIVISGSQKLRQPETLRALLVRHSPRGLPL